MRRSEGCGRPLGDGGMRGSRSLRGGLPEEGHREEIRVMVVRGSHKAIGGFKNRGWQERCDRLPHLRVVTAAR